MSPWRRSPAIAVAAVCMFLLIQIAVPLARLGQGDRAQRFGWQMFSTSEPTPLFTVVASDGSREVSIEDYMARTRAEVDIVGLMPPHLCEVIEGAVSIVWEGGEHTC